MEQEKTKIIHHIANSKYNYCVYICWLCRKSNIRIGRTWSEQSYVIFVDNHATNYYLNSMVKLTFYDLRVARQKLGGQYR